MASFLAAVTKTLRYEGGLADNPVDPGGLTNFGISIRSHPEMTPEQIRILTPIGATLIYRQQYWNDLYDEVKSQALVNSLFDFGVTSGKYVAVQTLQGILFARGEELWTSLWPRPSTRLIVIIWANW